MRNTENLASLRMTLEAEGIDFKKSSDFQGVLFEHMDATYADKMHLQQMHPYSQYLKREADKLIWYVNTTNNETYEGIIMPLMKGSFDAFVIKHGNIKVRINEKQLVTKDYSELLLLLFVRMCLKRQEQGFIFAL